MFELVVYDRDRDGNIIGKPHHFKTSTGERLEICYRQHLSKQPEPNQK